MHLHTLYTKKEHGRGIILMNRPEVRNAFNDTMVIEITKAIDHMNNDPDVDVVILRGSGKAFSSGADLNWLKDVTAYDQDKNLESSRALATCFYRIYTASKPVITVAHGAAIGGAVGLLVAADIAICTEDTLLSLSEVTIGLVPAVISPYIIKRIGEFRSKELMMTGKRFSGREAEQMSLVNKAVPGDQLEDTLEQYIKELRRGAPEAQRRVKQLVHQVANALSFDESLDHTARVIAEVRASDEGQEGMHAFLEKRKMNWRKHNL